MFHQYAIERLDRAEEWLNSDDPESLLYASLDLRMAIEHWFYDIREDYTDWIPEEVVRKWQPLQIMNAICEVDPVAFTDKVLQIGELVINSPSLDKIDVKKRHNGLGRYLHAPINRKPFDPKKWRGELEKVVATLQKLRTSTGKFVHGDWVFMNCACGVEIRRSQLAMKEGLRVTCPVESCQRQYVAVGGEQQLRFKGDDADAICPKCEQKFLVNRGLVGDGKRISCPHCKAAHTMRLHLLLVPDPSPKKRQI